jgi:hypothetical protein
MDRHSARSGRLAQAACGRQWSRRFPVLALVIAGGVLVACSSSTKPDDTQDPGSPENLVANSALTQNAVVSANVATRPSVKVTDAVGIGVPGVEVLFSVTGGGGTVGDPVRLTNSAGVATVGSWTMGAAAGANTLTASAAGLTGSPITFTATAATNTSNFNIKLVYLNAPTSSQQAAFENARSRWQAVVTSELSNIPFTNETRCGGSINETVDDLLILVNLGPIDGPGKVLGSAGPCLTRATSHLTVVGVMTFDTADLATLEAAGNLPDVILHEMGHVLGIGSLWDVFGLLADGCVETSPGSGVNVPGEGLTPTYTGASALAAYTGSNGGGSATAIPVENYPDDSDGCPNGTRDSHWEEGDPNPPNGIGFRSELMTGFISGTVRPMSLTTIRSLADLGYTVDNAQAQPFDINTQPTLRADGTVAPVFSLQGDVRRGPLYSVDDRPGGTGAIRRIR